MYNLITSITRGRGSYYVNRFEILFLNVFQVIYHLYFLHDL